MISRLIERRRTGRNCLNHPDRPATHSDAFVDLDNSSQFANAYVRLPICEQCAAERREQNTSRVEPIGDSVRDPVVAEREACAEIADERLTHSEEEPENNGYASACVDIAKAIRSRGDNQ